MTRWKTKNRHKFLLQYHVIFVCKYRKKLFLSKNISDDIKILSYDICKKHNIVIKYLETDKDHIHYMIESEPNISISKIISLIKSYTTYHIWKKYPKYLRKYFWNEKLIGVTDISLVRLVMYLKKLYINILIIRGEIV